MDFVNEKNRWEIKKIGLLNYWWYDEEEFEFSDGRLILRGTNGSGKSVTMQSFIPLLLDGNKSPERLDPFNTKARKIEDYILGYGDDTKEENTSYLYMEFCKKETKNYISIGMGLRAKKNNGVTFWGFIIKDGRRIGKDFFLYKDIGNKIPLTKAELKNRIGEGGQVVDTTAEYASLVNDNIFGFETLSEYQEFIKLLIEIRTPKLSKDGFKPSIITEIMSNSLRGLSDDDLKAVSESIENMNKTKEYLETLKISEKALKQIIMPYENYNKCVLFYKAKKYNEKQKRYTKTKKEAEELLEKIKTNKVLFDNMKKQSQDAETELEVYKYKEKELRNNEIWKQKEEKQKMEKDLQEKEEELKSHICNEEKKSSDIRKKENEYRETKDSLDTEKENFETVKNEMEQLANQINYDEYFFKMDEIKLNETYDYRYFKEDIKRYILKIEDGKKALELEKYAQNEYEIALQNLDKEKKKRAEQSENTDKARILLHESKENFIEELHIWQKENEHLKLSQEDMEAIARKVENYGEKAEFGDITQALNIPYNNKKQEYLNENAILNANKENINIQIEEVQKQIEDWKNQKEPEPDIQERVVKNRKNLKEKNIPFIEFYKAVDFKKDIDEKTRNSIESALLDMGILDAIIIPKQYREKISEIDLDFVDKYLFEKPIEFRHELSEILEVKIPKDCVVSAETVVNVLKSIMLDDQNESTYINEKGEYRIGVLQGISNNNEKAKYIGSKARDEYKQSQILLLQKQKEELEKQIEDFNEKIKNLDNKIQKLEEEYKKFPTKENLEAAYSILRGEIITLKNLDKNVIELENILSTKFDKLKDAKNNVKEKTLKLTFALTLEAYTENLDTANELKDLIFEMEKYHRNYINENEKLSAINSSLEDLKYDLDEVLYNKGKVNVKIQELKGKINMISQMAEVSDLEKQMDECMKKLQQIPDLQKKLAGEIGQMQEKIKVLEEQNLNLEEMVLNLEKQTSLSKEILKQELDLKYVIPEYEDINKITKQILDQYSHFDKETRNVSDYRNILMDKFRESNESLLDYNLSITEIFVTEFETEDEELIKLQKTRNRSDISCFVNGRKINFKSLKEYLDESIEETKNLVDDEDRHLFEEILIGAVGRKIRERIYSAKYWIDSMNKLMKSLNTSSGLSFSINWKPKFATDEEEIDTKEIVEILNSDAGLLRQEDIKKVATHFRSKFAKAEKEFSDKGAIVPFYSIIKDALDYRKWFEFQFMYKKAWEQSKELTNNAFFKLSGGEKAMAMYIPLFASVCARYQSAKKDCLRIISLDEAFAGVDDNNIRDMFRILTELELEYVINSQVLWGEYDTVPSLSICELISDVNKKIVSVMRYHWNGQKREFIMKDID